MSRTWLLIALLSVPAARAFAQPAPDAPTPVLAPAPEAPTPDAPTPVLAPAPDSPTPALAPDAPRPDSPPPGPAPDSAQRAPDSPTPPPIPGTCPRTSRQLGPSTAPLLDGLLGVPRRACFRSELSLGGDAYLIADPADFYGNIRVGGRVSGSVNLGDQVEIWGSFEAIRWQSLISAVSTRYLGTGYLTLGSSLRLLDEQQRRLAGWVRVVLPTTSGLDQNSQPLALEIGTTAEWNAHPNVRFHGALSLVGSIGVSSIAPPMPRGGVRVGGGLDWIPYEWLSFQLELMTGFGYRDGLDYLALAGGARLGLGDRIGVDLSVIWPFVGAERALAGAQVGVSCRFDDP